MKRGRLGFALLCLVGLTLAVGGQRASASIVYDDNVQTATLDKTAAYVNQTAAGIGLEPPSDLLSGFTTGQDSRMAGALTGLDLSNLDGTAEAAAQPPLESAAPGPPVPEPATLAIWSLLGGLGVAGRWCRRRRA
jgi:hypothetical protein